MRKRLRTKEELIQLVEKKKRRYKNRDYKDFLYDVYMLGNYDRIEVNWSNEKQ